MNRIYAFLAAVLLLPFAAAAQDDRGFLQGLIEDNLSSAGREVRIVGFEGALSSRATLQELTIADDQGVWLTMRGAVLDWNRSALLRGRLEVTTLSADELIVPRLPVTDSAQVEVPSAAAPGFALPDLPVSVEIGTLAIGRADLGEPLFGEAASISLDGSVSLIEGAGAADLTIERVDGKRGAITLDAAYSNATKDLAIDLTLSEAADGIAVNLLNLPGLPSADLTIKGTGTLSDFKADIRLATDDATRLAGEVTLAAETRGEGPPLRIFTADIGGDLAPVFAPQYRPFFGDNIQLQARGARRPDGALNLENLTLTAQSMTLVGQVAIGANGLPETIVLTGQIADPDGGAVLLPVGSNPVEVARVDLDVSFDATQGETWRATAALIGLDTDGLDASNVTLSGTGQIVAGTEAGKRVTAALDFQAQSLDMGSPELNQALGTEIRGGADIDWQQGSPVRITGLTVEGAGLGLTGSGTLDIEGADLAVTGTAAAKIEELAPFSGLAGRGLAGSAEARVSGSGALLGGAFDIEMTARGQDLQTSIAQVDPLLRGQSLIELTATRDETGLTIQRLNVQSPEVTGTLSGKLQAEGSALQAEASLREVSLVLPDLSGPLTFTATAEDTGGTWQVDAQATAPGAATISLDGRLRDILKAPVFDGTVRADIGQLGAYSAIAGRDLGGAVQGVATGTATLNAARLDLQLALTSDDLMIDVPQADALLAGRAKIDIAVQRDGDAVTVSSLVIDAPQVTGTASGTYRPGESAVKVDARLNEIGLILPQLSGAVGLVGEAREADGGWVVDARAVGPGVAVITVDGSFDDLAADPVFTGAAQADIRDLGAYARLAGRDLGGSIVARFTGTAALSGKTFDLDLSARSRDLAVGVAQADPLLKGQTTLDLTASRDADGIRIERLALQSPVLQATGAGRMQDGASTLRLEARLSDTSLVYPQMSGPLSLTADGTEQNGTWQVDLAADGPGGSVLRVAGALSDPLQAPAFDGSVNASADDLAPFSQLAGRSLGGAVQLAATGAFDSADNSYDGDITGSSSSLRIGQPEADKLLAGSGTYRASVSGKGTAIVIESLVVDTPQLDADVNGETDGEAINLAFDIRLANLGLFAQGIDGPLQVSGTARQAARQWTVDLSANGPLGSRASIAGGVAADFSTARLGIDGQAPLALANRFIKPSSVTGNVDFNLRLEGPPSLAALSGTVSVAQGRAVVPAPGLVLNDIGANVVLGGSRASVSAAATVQGCGRISIEGPVALTAPYSADLAIRLANVVITDPNLYKTTVDGQLTATGPLAGGATLTGTVNLGRTEIQIPSTGLGSTGNIPDITHVGEPAAVRATRARAGLLDQGGKRGGSGTGPRYPIDLQIVAANQIFIRGRGLDAELGGTLRLTGTTADLVPSGQFTLVRGRLDILGKRLTIDEGFARPQGSFVPIIRLVASTTSADVRILITIEGSASDPTITFSSEPELPEDEVLAQLLFGRGISQISPLQAAQLASAVATLAGRGGVGIVGRLRENFGLDDLDVTTDAEGNAAVRAGKYLGENIYTDVTVGSDSTEINLNLDISRTVTAKGSVSSTGETSLGIFFQRDY